MQQQLPIFQIDNDSVYDARTHKLIKLKPYNIENILACLAKSDQTLWQEACNKNAVLIIKKFPDEINKIIRIIEGLEGKPLIKKQNYCVEDIIPMLIKIMEIYQQAQQHYQDNIQKQKDQRTEEEQKNNIKITETIQNQNTIYNSTIYPQLSLEFQNSLPIQNNCLLYNVYEMIKGFYIKESWWEEFQKLVEKEENDGYLEPIINSIAPILVQRWKDAQQPKKKKIITSQKAKQDNKFLNYCYKLLTLTENNTFDVELNNPICLEARDYKFILFLEALYEILKQATKQDIKIEWQLNNNQAIIYNNNETQIFEDPSEIDLKIKTYFSIIQQLQQIRGQYQPGQTTFEIVVSILLQYLPKSESHLIEKIKEQIQINKQTKETHLLAQEIKAQVQLNEQQQQQQQVNGKKIKQSKDIKQFLKKQLQEYIQEQTIKNEFKISVPIRKSGKIKNKVTTVNHSHSISEEGLSSLSNFTFNDNEGNQCKKIKSQSNQVKQQNKQQKNVIKSVQKNNTNELILIPSDDENLDYQLTQNEQKIMPSQTQQEVLSHISEQNLELNSQDQNESQQQQQGENQQFDRNDRIPKQQYQQNYPMPNYYHPYTYWDPYSYQYPYQYYPPPPQQMMQYEEPDVNQILSNPALTSALLEKLQQLQDKKT